MNESVLFEQILHDIIVPVGIHAKMIPLMKCPLYAEAPDTLYGSIACQTVDHGIGAIVQPGAVLNDAVGRFDIPALAKEKGAKMAVRLKVSGPFHTKMLQPAADRLGPELEKMHISPMKIPVFTNVDAKEVASEKDIIPILTKQICCPVRFSDIIQNMHEKGADTFIELGPGKALCGFVKRTLKGVTILNVEDESSLAKTMSKLQE